jgi:hypothetical protein
MTDAATEDPAAIEREIRRTQDKMSRTVEKIGDQLRVGFEIHEDRANLRIMSIDAAA